MTCSPVKPIDKTAPSFCVYMKALAQHLSDLAPRQTQIPVNCTLHPSGRSGTDVNVDGVVYYLRERYHRR